MTGGHSLYDLSRSSEVNSDFPLHLKIKCVGCTNYVRNDRLLSKSAQSSRFAAALIAVRNVDGKTLIAFLHMQA